MYGVSKGIKFYLSEMISVNSCNTCSGGHILHPYACTHSCLAALYVISCYNWLWYNKTPIHTVLKDISWSYFCISAKLSYKTSDCLSSCGVYFMSSDSEIPLFFCHHAQYNVIILNCEVLWVSYAMLMSTYHYTPIQDWNETNNACTWFWPDVN